MSDLAIWLPEAAQEPEKSYSYINVVVLPYLKGRPMDEVARAFISTLRPSSVRVIKFNQAQHCDAQTWRVTVNLKRDGMIDCIHQECHVELPEGVDNGHELSLLLPECSDNSK